MTTLEMIPFSKLRAPDSVNARPATKAGLDELAASIASKGLIQPLAVRPADGAGGHYEIIAGRRRYAAMALLVKSKRMSKSDPVPAIVRNEDDQEALETSLIENTVRLPMHAVDQHEVFARLEAGGLPSAEIASRFAIPDRVVRQRLALGRLSPVVRKAWRDGKLDEKAAQAFTIDGRHDIQEAAWARLSKQRHGLTDYDVRRELSGDRPSARSLPSALVEAYLQAGGTITESLFDEHRLVDDPALLKKVRAEQFEGERQRLLGEGWSWVALSSDLRDPRWRWDWPNVLGDDEPDDFSQEHLTAEEQAHVQALRQQQEALPAGDEQDDQIEAQIESIFGDAGARSYSAEARARSGCVIDVRDGSVAYGLMRPDAVADAGNDDDEGDDLPSVSSMVGGAGAADDDGDASDPDTETGPHTSDADDEPDAPDAPVLSGALLETLTTAQTLAIAEALQADPVLALRCAIAALASEPWLTPVKLMPGGRSRQRHHGSFATDLAGTHGRSVDELLAQFAHLMRETIDAVTFNAGSDRDPTDALVAALPSDAYLREMRERFLPEDYFKRVPKALIIVALDEMAHAGCIKGLGPDFNAAKKGNLVSLAATEAATCGWLPPELRHPAYRIGDV